MIDRCPRVVGQVECPINWGWRWWAVGIEVAKGWVVVANHVIKRVEMVSSRGSGWQRGVGSGQWGSGW